MITQSDPPRLFAVRLVKGGPRVGVGAWYGIPADPITGEPLDRAARWQVTVSGKFVDPLTLLMLVGDVAYIKGDEISPQEYDYLMSIAAWAKRPGVNAPESDPRKAIDLNKLPPVF